MFNGCFFLCLADASPCSPVHLQSSSNSQYDNMSLEGVGVDWERGYSADAPKRVLKSVK